MAESYLVEPISSQLGIEQYAARLGPPFDDFVEVVWSVKGLTFYRQETLLPNCGIELMINFGSPQRVLARGDTAVNQEYADYWVSGLQNQTLTVESSAESNLLSIRFKPGGAHALFNLPIEEITNQVVALDALLGPQIEELRVKLGMVEDFASRLEIVRRWLRRQFAPKEYEYKLVRQAILALNDHNQRIQDVCDQIGLSNKYMWTLFKRLVGLPPKNVARLIRFQNAIAILQRQPAADWMALAYQLHYYDQSHLIHEFQAFAGITPTEYLTRRTPDGGSLHTEQEWPS